METILFSETEETQFRIHIRESTQRHHTSSDPVSLLRPLKLFTREELNSEERAQCRWVTRVPWSPGHTVPSTVACILQGHSRKAMPTFHAWFWQGAYMGGTRVLERR